MSAVPLLRRWLASDAGAGAPAAPEPALHFARTRDGVRLALYNYRPADLAPERFPVFLCHGLGSNRFDLDYPGRQSLARYLWARGHDVWVVELRGAGRSTKPSLLFGKLRYDWVFDDYVAHDIPAAVARVRELFGRPAIHWVGHSMGGMLAYPFLVSCDRDLVRSCVTVGAPSVAVVRSEVHDLVSHQIALLRRLPFIPWRHTGRALAPFVPHARRIVEAALGDFLYNPENMDDETIATLLRNAVENFPTSLVLQAAEFYDTKHYQSYYRTFSFRDNLHRIEVPLLVIAGSIDRLTPPEDLRFVFDHVSSRDKEFVVIGRAQGASAEYGHVDLILGRNAPEDVFPTIAAWIDRHDRGAERLDPGA